MTYLIAIGISFLLLASFTLLSALETRGGFRVFAGSRKRLDRAVSRVSYIALHIDWAGFTKHVAATSAERIAHDIVHAVLQSVRTAERFLTKTIKVLRERVARRTPSGEPVEGSQVIATIVRFRKSMNVPPRSNPKREGDTV